MKSLGIRQAASRGYLKMIVAAMIASAPFAMLAQESKPAPKPAAKAPAAKPAAAAPGRGGAATPAAGRGATAAAPGRGGTPNASSPGRGATTPGGRGATGTAPGRGGTTANHPGEARPGEARPGGANRPGEARAGEHFGANRPGGARPGESVSHGAHGEEIRRGPHGESATFTRRAWISTTGRLENERLFARRADHSRLVSDRFGHGYVERPYAYRGATFVNRTYYVGGVPYVRVYQPYVWGGVSLECVRAWLFLCGRGFTGYAYDPWAAPITFGWGWAGNPWYALLWRLFHSLSRLCQPGAMADRLLCRPNVAGRIPGAPGGTGQRTSELYAHAAGR